MNGLDPSFKFFKILSHTNIPGAPEYTYYITKLCPYLAYKINVTCWMGSHFHDHIDYNRVEFPIESLA